MRVSNPGSVLVQFWMLTCSCVVSIHVLTIIDQSDSDRFRFYARFSDPVDVLGPDTKLILALWKKVLETDRGSVLSSNGLLYDSPVRQVLAHLSDRCRLA